MSEDASEATGAAAPAVAETVASARAVPPAATPAACDRKRRRVAAAGIGVLFSESAWGMGLSSLLRVRAGAEVPSFPSACFCDNTVLMKRQTVITKKRRGPAPTGKGTLIGVRLQPAQLASLDAWITKQEKPYTRPEAIRGMMETILHILAKDQGEKPARKAKIR